MFAKKETTPVVYSAAAIKVLHFERKSGQKGFRMHWHDRMELIRVHKGELSVGYGTHSGTIYAGELMIIPPKLPHKGVAGKLDVIYDVIMFDVRSFYNDTDICRKYLPALFDGYAQFKIKTDDEETLQCFDGIYATAGKPSLAITAGVYQLLDLLFTRSLTEFKEDINDSVITKEMISYIEDNFAQDLSTAAISSKFGYTSAHFCRKFKEATGLTPMNYLKIFRLEQAYKLIKEGERNISAVADECGFSDANYFTRCFREHFGVPPTHFKKSQK